MIWQLKEVLNKMPELRKDYILDRFVIVSESRGLRPFEFKKTETPVKVETCFFCPGNEKLTPPEIARINDKAGKWKIRVFPNKFAAAKLEGNPEIRTDNKYYTFSSAYGQHEIIVETPDNNKQLHQLDKEEIAEILKVYKSRIIELRKTPNIKYVCIFKNHGIDAGTSIAHSHTQVITTNLIPTEISDKLEAISRYQSCPYCEIIRSEKDSYRRCYENNYFVAFAPYASRFHYEIWVFPKQHIKSITDMDDNALSELADIMKKILIRIGLMNVSYNMSLQYSDDEKFHFHIEFMPRISIFGGFEFATGITINSVSPEDAAKFYRGD